MECKGFAQVCSLTYTFFTFTAEFLQFLVYFIEMGLTLVDITSQHKAYLILRSSSVVCGGTIFRVYRAISHTLQVDETYMKSNKCPLNFNTISFTTLHHELVLFYSSGVDHIEPEWRMMDQFYFDMVVPALDLDSLSESHPVSVSVHDPKEIEAIFDAISYKKGAAIVHMLEDTLGETVVRKGLRKYLNVSGNRSLCYAISVLN